MIKHNALSSLKKEERVSLFKKKLIVFCVFACMTINGFVHSTAEISKYSLVMIMAVVTQNVVSEVFSKCNDSLMTISNKVSADILGFLFVRPFDGQNINKNTGTQKNGASNDDAVLIRQAVIKEIKKMKDNSKNKIPSFFAQSLKLFDLYHNYKIPDSAVRQSFFILLFLFLIICIVRKKEYDEAVTIFINKLKKTRISAY